MIKRILIIGFLITLFSHVSASFSSIDNRFYFENYSLDEKLAHTHVLSIFQDKTGYIWVGTYGGIQMFNGFNFSDFQTGIIKQTDLSSNYILVTYEDKANNLWFGTDIGLYFYDRKKRELNVYRYDSADSNSISDNHIRTIYEDEEGSYWIGTYGGGLNKFNPDSKRFTPFRAKPGNNKFIQSDLINKFFVDGDGLFWIGTENGGISVFDRSKNCVTKTYSTNNSNISSNIINDIYQDIYGTLWIGTWEGGLNRYNPNSDDFITYMHNDEKTSLNCNIVRSIIQADENNLWIATFGGGLNLFNIKTGKFQKIEITTSKRKNSSWEFIWTLYKDREGNLWMGTFGAGLMKLVKLRNTFPEFTLINQKNGSILGISSVIEDKHGILWLATLDDGIHLYNRKTNQFSEFRNIGNKYITVLYKDREDRIWAGTSAGLYLIQQSDGDYIVSLINERYPKGMSVKTISSILEDQTGNIWIGFYGGGVSEINQEDILKNHPSGVNLDKLSIDINKKSTINNVWYITEDRKKHIWIGNSDKLICYTPAIRKFNYLPIIDVSSIYEDPQGIFWMGTLGNGMYKIDANLRILKHFQLEEGLRDLIVVGMLADANGKLWIATAAGLSQFNPENETFINYDVNYGLQGGFYTLNSQASLSSGEMFFGGNNGFNIFNPQNINRQIVYPKVVISDIKLNFRSLLLNNKNDTDVRVNIFTSEIDKIKTEKNTKTISIEFAALNYSISKEIVYSYILEGYDEDWILTNSDNRRATYTNLDGGRYTFKVRASNEKGNWSSNVTQFQIIVQPPFWKTWWFRISLILAIICMVIYYYRHRVTNLQSEISYYKERNLSEKLLNEQELLKKKNDELSHLLEEKGKQLASIAVNQVDHSDWLDTIYKKLLEMRQYASSVNISKFNQILSLFEKKSSLSRETEYNENFDLIYENFTNRFAAAYPRITHKDLRICSYIRMNKSNKEIAALLSITQRSLEISRYRIRKKIGLNNSTNLNDFILRF